MNKLLATRRRGKERLREAAKVHWVLGTTTAGIKFLGNSIWQILSSSEELHTYNLMRGSRLFSCNECGWQRVAQALETGKTALVLYYQVESFIDWYQQEGLGYWLSKVCQEYIWLVGDISDHHYLGEISSGSPKRIFVYDPDSTNGRDGGQEIETLKELGIKYLVMPSMRWRNQEVSLIEKWQTNRWHYFLKKALLAHF